MPNNRFTLFPIELHAMKSLKKLNLYNNAISLLPRDINLICRLELDELDLGKYVCFSSVLSSSSNLLRSPQSVRNQLKALPVEFVDLLESIPVVNLNDNPWTLLPSKWGRRREGMQSTDAPLGYNLPDALDFLYAMRLFYNIAEEVWHDFGVFYYSNKLTLNDFVQEIKNRIPKTWHDGLLVYAEHIYFKVIFSIELLFDVCN